MTVLHLPAQLQHCSEVYSAAITSIGLHCTEYFPIFWSLILFESMPEPLTARGRGNIADSNEKPMEYAWEFTMKLSGKKPNLTKTQQLQTWKLHRKLEKLICLALVESFISVPLLLPLEVTRWKKKCSGQRVLFLLKICTGNCSFLRAGGVSLVSPAGSLFSLVPQNEIPH